MKFCPIKDFSHVTRCAWLAFCTCRERRPPAGGLGALGNRHTGTPLPSFFSELSWGPEGLGGALRAPIYDALHWGAVGQLFQFIPPLSGPSGLGYWQVLGPTFIAPRCPATFQTSLCRWHHVALAFRNRRAPVRGRAGVSITPWTAGSGAPRRGNAVHSSGKHQGCDANPRACPAAPEATALG